MNLISSFREKLTTGWRSHYFRKNFILILLITAIPGIISALGIFWFGVGKIEDELMIIHENQVAERVKNIDDQFNYLEESLSYWAYDPRFDSSLLDLDFVYQFQETRDITKSLIIIEGSHPLIKDAELFVDTKNKPILFNTYYKVVTEQEEIDYLRSILNEKNHSIDWHYFHQPPESLWENGKLALIHNIPGVSEPPFGMLILTINKSNLAQLLETLTPYDKGATFLISPNHETLVSSNKFLDSNFENALKTETLDQLADHNNSFQFDWDNESYSISYGMMDRMGEEWMYISAAPISSITAPVINISKIILIVSLTALLIALIMSWFASTNIYRPMGKLLQTLVGEEQEDTVPKRTDEFEFIKEKWLNLADKSEELQEQMSKQIPQLKQNFLTQLKRGYLYEYSESDLRKRMERYGWQVHNQYFILLDVQLIGIYEAEIAMGKDESLFSFAVANIMDELVKDYFEQFTILNYYDSSVGIFIVIDKHKNVEELTNKYVQEVTEAINNILKLKVTVTISEKIDEVKSVPFLFNKVEQGKRYRDFDNQNQFINLSELDNQSDAKELLYPFEIEKSIIQAVRRGRISEAENLVRQFIKGLTEKESKEIDIQQSMIQLFSTIQHEILRSGIQPNEIFENKNMIEELSKIREPEWMVRWLVDNVIEPYIQILEGKMDLEMKRIVESVKEYMKTHYMDDISLDSCADISGISSYSLSKAFNKVLGINFIDYLTDLRIEKAKELLVTTDDKIGDIAESVGYRHSYFNRVFKRQVGVPPSQYRKSKAN